MDETNLDLEASIECSRNCLTPGDNSSLLYYQMNDISTLEDISVDDAKEAEGDGIEEMKDEFFKYSPFVRKSKCRDFWDMVNGILEDEDPQRGESISFSPRDPPQVDEFDGSHAIANEFQKIIEKRDEQIELLIGHLEVMTQEKKNYENESILLFEKIGVLEKELRKATEETELYKNELNSYHQLPQNLGFIEAREVPRQKETVPVETQRDTPYIASMVTVDQQESQITQFGNQSACPKYHETVVDTNDFVEFHSNKIEVGRTLDSATQTSSLPLCKDSSTQLENWLGKCTETQTEENDLQVKCKGLGKIVVDLKSELKKLRGEISLGRDSLFHSTNFSQVAKRCRALEEIGERESYQLRESLCNEVKFQKQLENELRVEMEELTKENNLQIRIKDEELFQLRAKVIQFGDVEKKYGANLKYLEEQTSERELERDEFFREREELEQKLKEGNRERKRLAEGLLNQRMELEDLEERVKEAGICEEQTNQRTEKVQDELKSAVTKIYELREIIRELEEQIDSSTRSFKDLQEQNESLREEIEFLEKERKEDTFNASHETFVTANSEWVGEEVEGQLRDLLDRVHTKLAELETFKWSGIASRPGSSISNEDVSLRELNLDLKEVTAAHLSDGIRRLDLYFDNFLKFEEIIIKKLLDTEFRLTETLKRQEEMELEKSGSQEKLKEELLKVSELECRVDQLRFEPSPNAVTLSGLRMRVKLLTEEIDEAKRQLHLKNIELEDLKEKNAANEALVKKYAAVASAGTRRDPLPKLSITTQTQWVKMESTVQTEPLSTKDTSVQTNSSSLFEPMDISSISGNCEPKHSTPKDNEDRKRSALQTIFTNSVSSPEILRHAQKQRNQLFSDFGIIPNSSDITFVGDSGGGSQEEDPDSNVLEQRETELNRTVESGDLYTEENLKPRGVSLDSSEKSKEKSVLKSPLPCIPQSCEEVALLLQIEKLKNDNIILETKLEFYLADPVSSNQTKSDFITPSTSFSVSTTPNLGNVRESELKTHTNPVSVELSALANSYSEEGLCTMGSSSQKELRKELAMLQEEKATMECRLAGRGSHAIEQQLENEQRRGAAASARLDEMAREKEVLEAEVHLIEEMSKARAKQLESLLAESTAEKLRLEAEVEIVKKELLEETKERHQTQESFNNARVSLQKHLATDRSLREENLTLMSELNSLRQYTETQNESRALNLTSHIYAQPNNTNKQNRENLELYLRAKSYRKALTWQKKYLSLVIQGYKSLVEGRIKGIEHWNLLQNDIPLSPTSHGIIDTRAPLTRFRICSTAILATIRMKFMVRRWDSRSVKLFPSSSSSTSTGHHIVNGPETARRGFSRTSGSELGGMRRRMSIRPGLSLSCLSGISSKNIETVLSDYLRRIQSLEQEVGDVLSTTTTQHQMTELR